MKKIQSACVYCGASNRLDSIYREAADRLGQLLAEADIKLVFGGGRVGLMEIVANATIKNGGRAMGVLPQNLEEIEGAYEGSQELHIVDSMHTRKAKMGENSDAFIILPGGFGTLDEFFEVLTWRQIKLHTKPIVLVNINNYWDPLVSLMHNIVQHKFATISDIGYVSIVSSVDEAMQLLINMD